MINDTVQSDPMAMNLINTINSQFYNRTKVEGRKVGNGIDNLRLEVEVGEDMVLWLHFISPTERHSVSFPMPFFFNGVQLIQQNEVLRAVSNFWFEHDNSELNYNGAMYKVILSDCTGLVSPALSKKSCYLQQMIYGFANSNAAVIANRFQRAINDVVHKMPLHETLLNSFVMNNRLMIVDPCFDELRSPSSRLAYQVSKAKKYFDRGWSGLGLSDGVLADKNYLLKVDLRRLSPFGIRWHNPQRNLFSTLGMKGDELPLIRSQSMQALMDAGITRGGWNFVTAFADIPDVFEDQIVLGKHLVDKISVHAERRLQVFGDILVKEGQSIKRGTPIGTAPQDGVKCFDVECDSAIVKRVVESKVNVGGNQTKVYNVVVTYTRNLKDGFKFTNLHGNKGVIRVFDIGYATNPATGEKVQIDVVVGGKTVGKRKNFGQVLEALITNILPIEGGVQQPAVLADDWHQSVEEISRGLVSRGFRADGTWDCDTYAGKLTAVVGKVFWGCIKTPEDQIWEQNDLLSRNCTDLRTKGLKFSHVEMRALKTRFGDENPVLDELLSYVQGTENLHELITMAKAKRGELPNDKPILTVDQVKPLDQSAGTIIAGQWISGTVVDEFFMPNGFVLRLPIQYQTILDKNDKIVHEGSPMATLDPTAVAKAEEVYTTSSLYIPSGIMRKCWRHENGMYGLSEIGVIVNNVLVMAHRLIAAPEEAINHRLYYTALYSFFDSVSTILCSKRGEISKLGMSVRYPFSTKAVATLSSTLPKNTVEIHRSLANILKVSNGDVVVAERFPCLGFMSVRLQRVRITDDPMCKYTIRASGNSLVSTNLDHDGDVLYLAAFHTPEAREAIKREFDNPNQTCYGEICKLNDRKGAPHVKCYGLSDFNLSIFQDLTNQRHAEILEMNTGVKAQTGPVIALTYNLMRIVENSTLATSQKMKVAVEMFLEKAAQSVFEQKHGGRSLYSIVIDGVCTGDVETLVSVGFRRSTTERLCALISAKAAEIGIFDLRRYHADAIENGKSNIISLIVRKQNKIYFASRSKIEAIVLLKALESPVVDIPSAIFSWVASGKAAVMRTKLDDLFVEEAVAGFSSEENKDACCQLVDALDVMFRPKQVATIREIVAHMLGRVRADSGMRSIACR